MPSKCCNDKGWVQAGDSEPTLCPVCKGESAKVQDTPAKRKYDQSAIWLKMHKEFPDSIFNQIAREVDRIVPDLPATIIAHLLFDRNVSPEGNLIFDLMRAPNGQPKLTADALKARRYVTTKDGDVYTVHDIPVSPAYMVIQKWYETFANTVSSELKLDPSRKGDPFFMDNEMVAFGIKSSSSMDVDWVVDHLRSIFSGLVEVLERGETDIFSYEKSDPIGTVVNLRLIVA